MTLLTGEAGTGKTTLIYSLLQRDYKRVRIAHIDDPKLSFLEIMQAVMTELNLYCAGSTKLDYLNTLDHLLERHGKEERIAIVVDEAQLMSTDVLEDLRLLSNRAQLQLILVGQPELAERLKRPELRQLNQRISSRGVLKPLTPEQAQMYVECRLSVKGGKCSTIFEPGALHHLLRRSDGLPRKINMLCQAAMMAAFDALESKVSVRIAKKTAAEYHESVRVNKRGPAAPGWIMPAFLTNPTFIVGTVSASLLLVGFVYPNVRSGWGFNHAAAYGGPIAQTVPAVKSVQQVHAVEQLGVAMHPDSDPKPIAGASLAPPQTVKLPASPDLAAASGSAQNAVGAPAPEPPAVRLASAATAPSAGIQRHSGGPSVSGRRTQITVRQGDTLEKIAIQYFGSNSGINELVAANPQLTDINQLSVGQIIYLPAGITSKASHYRTATAGTASN
ncbi:MAG TPA: AAA family ATPase [Candidatus Binataceae bacterium]|nr:AAA family ATPase [Candidatus Binataceae bacterium]